MAELLINNRESHGIKEKGDIVCVRPDGFKWSESELSKVIKIPGLKYEDAVYLERSLSKDEGTEKSEMVKHRKYKISDVCFTGDKLDTSKITSFQISNITEKKI